MKLPPAFRYAALTLALLSSFLILSNGAVANANTACIITGQVVAPDTCIISAFPYMAIGILISFMVVAIVYMLGNVMNFGSMQNWYRAELWETIKTIIMVVVVISVLVILSAIANILVGAQYTLPGQQGEVPGVATSLSTNLANLYNADSTFLAQQLNGSYQAYAAVLGLSTGVGVLQSLAVTMWVPLPLIPPYVIGSIQFGSSENLLNSNFITATGSQYSITQNIIGLVVIPMLITFQVLSTYFYQLMAIGLGILIPLGVIFRAFPLVRNIGGTFIATGIGISLVFPALLLIVNLPISNYIYAFTYSQTLNGNCPFTSGLICNLWLAMTTGINGDILGPGVTGTIINGPLNIALGTVASNNANVVSALDAGYYTGIATPLTYGIFPSLNLILANTLGMILQMILLGIDIMVGLIVTGAITHMLGGKVRLGFGSKLSFRTG
ncbi:MAG: hypothetical protein KGH94_02630 [Candidatus Micrarchaeota archaeon]|nr:hypothetical protein [Candidatus Micrarchaeota archaeon]